MHMYIGVLFAHNARSCVSIAVVSCRVRQVAVCSVRVHTTVNVTRMTTWAANTLAVKRNIYNIIKFH